MAELKLVNQGALKALPLDNMSLVLFTNDITPTKDSVYADFTFASGGGADPKTLSQGSWTPSEVGGIVQFEYPEQTWNFTGSGTYYGVAIITSANKVHYASRFDSAWTFNSFGGSGSVTPVVQIFSEAVISSPSSSPSSSASSSPSPSVSSSPSSSASSSPSSSVSSSVSSSASSSPSPSISSSPSSSPSPSAAAGFTEGFQALSGIPGTGDSGYTVSESIYYASDYCLYSASGGRAGAKCIQIGADAYEGSNVAALDIAGVTVGAGSFSFYGKDWAADSAGTIQLKKNNANIGTAKTSVTPPGGYTKYTFTGLPAFSGETLTIHFIGTTGDYFTWYIDDLEWIES